MEENVIGKTFAREFDGNPVVNRVCAFCMWWEDYRREYVVRLFPGCYAINTDGKCDCVQCGYSKGAMQFCLKYKRRPEYL